MANWHDYLKDKGTPPSWPYPVRYEEEHEVETDILVVGGGIAGCWAAISAAKGPGDIQPATETEGDRSGNGP